MTHQSGNLSTEVSRTGAGPPEPFVTVILMASRHREFVLEAIDSVRRQTLDPKQYELVVVHDYDDEVLERKVDGMGGRLARVGPGDIGPAIGAGVEASRGQILTFLDDDDRYLPNRLAFIYEMFRKDGELGFVKNNFVVIDASGRQLPRHPLRARQRRNSKRLGPVVLRQESRAAQLRRLLPLGVDFNSSCMAVRRDLVVNFLRNMELSGFRLLDELAFFSTLVSSKSVSIDPTILTEYRIHSGNVTVYPKERAGSPLSRRAAFSNIILPSYAKLAEAVRTTGDKLAIAEADGLLEVQRAYAALRDPSTPRPAFVQFRQELTRRRSAYLVRSEARLRQALWLFSLTPRVGRWLYAREVRALET
jgi:hypothetical protein